MAQIDDTDREIIRYLQNDGRMSFSKLGPLVGLSDAATRNRVNRLTDDGVIDIVAVTDPVKLGLGFQALLGITISDDIHKVSQHIGSYSDVVYLVMTAGRYDLIAEVVTGDADAFVELSNEIRIAHGVESVEQLPYLGITKQTYDWGVG